MSRFYFKEKKSKENDKKEKEKKISVNDFILKKKFKRKK